MTITITESRTTFRPTDQQIVDAKDYLADTGLDSLIVAVCFPGKKSGEWREGLVGLAIMDGGLLAIWIDRESALYALDKGTAGHALFRVYKDGCYNLVDVR